MAAPPRPPLTSLPKGHTFPETTFTLSRDDVAAYLQAVGDGNTVYLDAGLAPPLAAAAKALASLLAVVELPGGSLHTSQEVGVRSAIPIGRPLTMSGVIAQRSERAGLVITAIDFAIAEEGAPGPALTGRTTVMGPEGGG